jgi:5'-3' exonuclease
MANVLLVDGDNLLTIGFYGLKNHFYKGRHIGAMFHFLNTLRLSFENYHLDKIVVFWDGDEASLSRKKIYHLYKENRKERLKTEEEISSYNNQRNRVKQYLEELFVRQGEYRYCETDDCIAYYTQNSPNENKIIFSSDGDLTQLLSENTQLYNPSHRKLYKLGDTFVYEREEIKIENVKIAKMLCGDKSDNISGIKSMGIKSLIKLFPEILYEPLSIETIIEKGNVLFEENKHNNLVKNLLTGVTKHGVFGDEFFEINKKIVLLDKPILTDEAIDSINQLIAEDMDPEGRSYKNTMKMMIEDGLFNVLPKSDDAWVNFLNPFLRLTRKEKNKKRTIKLKNYEQSTGHHEI